jgi:uncharacterized protein YegP (UPF0339 family)
MRKLFVCVALLAGMAASITVMDSASLAQGTKKDKKDKTKEKAAAVIEITEGKDGKYRFFVRNAEGKLLAMSSPGGFASEKEAAKAIEELREVVRTAKVTHGKGKKAKGSK